MTPEKNEDFLAWLDKELSERHLTDYKLAQLAHISHSVLSNIRKGQTPTVDTLVKLSKVLKVEDVFLLRLAGLIPTPSDFDPVLESMKAACVYVPKHQRPLALKILRDFSEEESS